uniref:Uncharacterized protein n=1 Tax=viral metagenome TaxID=1070528 RepID=A0A6M3Y2X1_9ZZZZ
MKKPKPINPDELDGKLCRIGKTWYPIHELKLTDNMSVFIIMYHGIPHEIDIPPNVDKNGGNEHD